VEKDGSVTNVKVKQSISPELGAETVRVIKLLPKFNPGKNKNGEPVRCNYGDFPFTYALQTN
jgi:outer membrane biosynthesis protein TonB